VAVTAFDPLGIEDQAYKESLTTSPAGAVEFLLGVLGAQVTAAALGLADARPLYRWRTGEVLPKERVIEDRLRILHRVTRMVSEAYGPRVASAFWRSSNPQLDDEAPLVILADGDPREVQARLVGAARAFLEG
jgi:hypothetical protein